MKCVNSMYNLCTIHDTLHPNFNGGFMPYFKPLFKDLNHYSDMLLSMSKDEKEKYFNMTLDERIKYFFNYKEGVGIA